MYGSLVLLVSIFISSLPIVAVYIWLRSAKYQVSTVWFLFALLTGATAFFPALILQEFVIFSSFTQGRAALFFNYFIRIALTEELSRLLMLVIFFWINSQFQKEPITEISRGATAGLIAGFGFSILESARYAAGGLDISIMFLRIFTAALHGACGSRIGAAAILFRTNPVKALLRIFTAVAIHGVYNFMVTMPGLLSIAAFLIAVSALITAILTIRSEHTLDNTE